MAITEDLIRRSLEQIGRALTEGNPSVVADAWKLPGLVLSDAGSLAVSDLGELTDSFAQAIEVYRARGTRETRPEIQHVELLTDKLATVDVRWPGLDADGVEISTDTSRYIMHLGDDGEARILRCAFPNALASG